MPPRDPYWFDRLVIVLTMLAWVAVICGVIAAVYGAARLAEWWL